MSGWLYGVYHKDAPAEGGIHRIKFGKSRFDPKRDSLDGRVRKLDLSLVALGFAPVSHAFEPFQVPDHSAFERRLKDELKELGKIAPTPGKRYLTEVCEMPIDDFKALVSRLRSEMGV